MQVGAGADQEKTEDGKGKGTDDKLAGRSSGCGYAMVVALVGQTYRTSRRDWKLKSADCFPRVWLVANEAIIELLVIYLFIYLVIYHFDWLDVFFLFFNFFFFSRGV